MKTLYRGKGDVILEEGETTDDAYIILDGEIDVTVKNVGKVATLSKNDIFGEITSSGTRNTGNQHIFYFSIIFHLI